jgi:hypothetical protein
MPTICRAECGLDRFIYQKRELWRKLFLFQGVSPASAGRTVKMSKQCNRFGDLTFGDLTGGSRFIILHPTKLVVGPSNVMEEGQRKK